MKIWILLSNVEKDISEYEDMGKGKPEYEKILQNIKVIQVEKMNVSMSVDGGTKFIYEGEELDVPDVFWPMITNSDAYILERMLLRAGSKCLIDLDEKAASKSKLLTYQRLADAKIKAPRTVAFFGEPDKKRILQEFAYPFIIKPDNGFGGQGVELIKSEEEFDDYIKKTIPGAMYVVQEFISTSKGKDVRVVMVQGKYYWSIMRQAGNADEFRSNVHAGGSYKEYPIDKETEELCEKIASLYKLPILGVDLMFGEDGFIVTEVNSFPGLFPDRLIDVTKKIFGQYLI